MYATILRPNVAISASTNVHHPSMEVSDTVVLFLHQRYASTKWHSAVPMLISVSQAETAPSLLQIVLRHPCPKFQCLDRREARPVHQALCPAAEPVYQTSRRNSTIRLQPSRTIGLVVQTDPSTPRCARGGDAQPMVVHGRLEVPPRARHRADEGRGVDAGRASEEARVR